MITLIAAVNHHMLLGKDKNIPWHVPEDLMFFKKQTMNKTLLMGRKTYESLPKKLDGRNIFVLTNQHDYRIEDDDCAVIFDVNDLIMEYDLSNEELMVAGGGSIYQLMMPYADKIILSVIDDYQHGDVYFPIIKENEFEKINRIDFETFYVLEYKRRV